MEEEPKLSLECPVSFTRMRYPVRSIHCTHRMCFDLISYLQIGDISMVYICPYCNRHIPLRDLAISEQMLIACRTMPSYLTHVIVTSDGPYKPDNLTIDTNS